VSSEESMRNLSDILGDQKLDLLINNSGILSVESVQNMDFEAIRRQFEVNAIGPLRVTTALRKSLMRGSKVIIITSRMGCIGDNTSGGFYGYRMSKAAVNMAGVSLARDLLPHGIIVQMLHPGMVETDMTAQFGGGISAEESARGLVKRIEEATIHTSGKIFHMNGEELPF